MYKRQIKYIAKANGYKRSIVDNLVKKHRKKKNNIELQENNRNKIRYIASEYGNTLPKILNKVFSGINIKTVSYTHLDVYKRQAIDYNAQALKYNFKIFLHSFRIYLNVLRFHSISFVLCSSQTFSSQVNTIFL